MKILKISFLTFVLLLGMSKSLYSAPDSVRIDTIDNYKGWGWEVLVIQNNFITLGIVPSIGGRVLQYDLGVDTFMIINPGMLGEVFDPATNLYGPWTTWGYGGYKTWPAPQNKWPGQWPPPPFMAWGEYTYEVLHASNDSVVVWLKGQTETRQTPGLRFDRYITAYRNTTRVKVETVLFNDNASAQEWSIWDVTQTPAMHGNDNDYDNFSAYVPLASASDIWDDGGGPDYTEVLPGIFELKFASKNGKIFSTASEGWSCLVDERDSQCYAKLFDLVEGAAYPDNGANVEYYTNAGNKYFEMEILGPLATIGANGDSIIFVEDWYVGTTNGPMYTTNHAGVVRSPLSYDRDKGKLGGEFAAFSEGEFKASLLDKNKTLLSTLNVAPASPNELTRLNEMLDLNGWTRFIELDAYDVDGNMTGNLGEVELVDDDSFVAYKAPITPTINGLADEAFWDTTAWYPLSYVWLPYNDAVSPDDFTGRFKISWTDDRLLLLVEVVDNVLYDEHTNPLDNYWNDDCVEVFLDEDHSGGNHLNSFNAFAYHVGLAYDVVDNGLSGAALFNDNIEVVRTEAGNTYTWELSIKVFDDSYVNNGSSTPVSLTHEKEMGFSLAYCDNDASPQRENFIGSKYLPQAQSNDSYINASLFGTLTLIDPNAEDPEPLPEEILTRKDENYLKIFPNPAEDFITYQFTSELLSDGIFQIRSLTGQVIRSGKVPAGTRSGVVKVDNLPGGIYFMVFVSSDLTIGKQIVIR